MSNNTSLEGSESIESNELGQIVCELLPDMQMPKTTQEDQTSPFPAERLPTKETEQHLEPRSFSPPTAQGYSPDDTWDSDSNIYTDISASDDRLLGSPLQSGVGRRDVGSPFSLLESGNSNPVAHRRPALQLPQGPSIEVEYLLHGVPTTLAAWFGITPVHPHIKATWLKDTCDAIQRDHGLCPYRDTSEFVTQIDLCGWCPPTIVILFACNYHGWEVMFAEHIYEYWTMNIIEYGYGSANMIFKKLVADNHASNHVMFMVIVIY
ncbi:hypothetical protein BKA70DRAFT_1236431 [Coprinopsis sp. MPI-PUGE-AT-0042]|nr:hypothetical protein BKA70DRAFT_1236431 [Coprinopsis sp. MPI-PUGE-AT-0042]